MTGSPDCFDELGDLVEAQLHGRLTEQGAARLESLLGESAENRETYTLLINDASTIRRWACPATIDSFEDDEEPLEARVFTRRGAVAMAVAASLLIGAALFSVYVSSVEVHAPPRRAVVDPKTPPPVATVIDAAGGTLLTNDIVTASGQDFVSGEVMLDFGEAELLLRNGTGVVLRGATRMAIHSTRHASLASGWASFDCPPRARGYTLDLPRGLRVVDLGTAFSARVGDDGDIAVWVDEGVVEVHAPDAEPRVLRAGQSLVFDHPESAQRLATLAERIEAMPALTTWLAADEGVEAGPDGAVVAWRSRVADPASAGAMTATASDPARAPRRINGAIDGRPVLRFDGIDDRLDTASRPWSPGRTMIAVARAGATQGAAGGYAVSIGDFPSVSLVADQSWVARRFVGAGSEQLDARGAAASAGRLTAAALVFDAESLKLTVSDGTRRVEARDPTTRLPLRSATLNLGNHSRFAQRAFAGDLAEVIVFDRALTDAELDTVLRYLGEKYDLSP